jgi:hypothetical protein
MNGDWRCAVWFRGLPWGVSKIASTGGVKLFQDLWNRIPNRIQNPEVENLESGIEILGPLMPNKGVCSLKQF